jgi:hypothetical protein
VSIGEQVGAGSTRTPAAPRRRRGLMGRDATVLLDAARGRSGLGPLTGPPRVPVPVGPGTATKWDGIADDAHRRSLAACDRLDAAARAGTADAEHLADVAADHLATARRVMLARDLDRRRVACLAPLVADLAPNRAARRDAEHRPNRDAGRAYGPTGDAEPPPGDGLPDHPRTAARTLSDAPQAPPAPRHPRAAAIA